MYNKSLHFYFVGIGGVGMSGIAEVLLNLGFKVSGSDSRASDITRRLEGLGAKIFIGHRKEHLPAAASLLVYTSAVNNSNPEVKEAKKRGIPIVRRAEVLAELMRLKFGVGVAGSHGKTTTTSMTAAILEAGGLDPTVIIGGQVTQKGTGARLGKSDFLVAETDESDRSFLLLSPTIAIVTNIDDEHMAAYKSRADLDRSFRQYVESIPFYGLAILCIDDPTVREIAKKTKLRKVTYGFSEEAQIRATDITGTPEGMKFTVLVRGQKIGEFKVRILGRHIVQNALAAIAVGLELGMDPEIISSGLSSLPGVKRRLELIRAERGITVINDYGHHPTEIKATLAAIKECYGGPGSRIIAAFQPHRFTRTRDCWEAFLDSFSDADILVTSDIYAASEEVIEGINGETLHSAIRHPQKYYEADVAQFPEALAKLARPGDVIVLLGAGSIGYIPEKVLESLKADEVPPGLPEQISIH